MTGVPDRAVTALVCAAGAYVAVFGAVVALGHPVQWIGLAVLLTGLAAGLRGGGPLPAPRTAVVTAAAVLLPVLGAVGLDPRGSYADGAWYVGGVSCLAILLFGRGRAAAAVVAVAALVVHTVLWAGMSGLNAFGVIAALLLLAVLAAGSRALERTAAEVARYSALDREALEQQAAQDAYETVRQERLRETARIGGPLLQRIVDADGRLDPAGRREARIMEQTVRDEIRGRALLDEGVRREVLRLRRAGAVVQVNDDGGLDGLAPADAALLRDRIAEALAPLTSDRVIIRTAPAESRVALTVVAMSVDPIAAALGMDDEDEQVDLWLELERPGVPAPGVG